MGRYLHVTGKDHVGADEGDYLLEWEEETEYHSGRSKIGRMTEIDATTMGYLAGLLERGLGCRVVWHRSD